MPVPYNFYEASTPERVAILGEYVDKLMPVGYVYISFSPTSPAEMFGGNWESIKGRFLLAGDESGELGGEETHMLTEEEMPTHTHGVASITMDDTAPLQNISPLMPENGVYSLKDQTDESGAGKPHNNMPPYITCYMWKRVG